MNYILIGLGGAAGALCRYHLGLFISKRSSVIYPFGTFFINSSGSFLLGLLVNFQLRGLINDWAIFIFGIGFCGAYTTFSTFGNETVQLLVGNKVKTAIFYIVTTTIISFTSAWIGLVV
ncbi:fluoride efflux transporter CrcB [Calidifontibacillus oryziterrae]|uniref:fluoride efflux transporter CrcB n=1 Tax=Calidifontibacillus oryziterrae TaxID=1191699 RepID=UPI00030F6876|nr:fluoride efflux transporter CrcB [Calidifontibacillus oryziterrae]